MRRWPLWWIASIVLYVSGARAETRTLVLDWMGSQPAGCPGEAALRSAVREALGRDPFVAASEWRVGVAWASEGEALSATIRLQSLEGERGVRRLVAPRGECAALHRSAALMVALAIDPLRVSSMPALGGAGASVGTVAEAPVAEMPTAQAPVTEGAGVEAPIVEAPIAEAPVAPAPGAAVGVEPAPASGAMLRVERAPDEAVGGSVVVAAGEAAAGAGAAGDGAGSGAPRGVMHAGFAAAGGVVPGPTLAVRLGGGVRWPQVSVGLEGRWWMASERAFGSGRFRVEAVDVAAEGCGRAWGSIAGCATVAVGRVSATGEGYGDGEAVEALSVVLGGRLRARVLRVGRVEASVVVDVGASLAGVRLEAGGARAWETPVLVLGAGGEVAVDVF